MTSAGYDRVDVEAARKAKGPVANNEGANSVAVAVDAVMPRRAVLKKLVYHHLNMVSGTWAGQRLRRRSQLRAELVELAMLHWRIERDYQELKDELGLDHFEGRGWRGFSSSRSLCIAA